MVLSNVMCARALEWEQVRNQSRNVLCVKDEGGKYVILTRVPVKNKKID